MAVDGATITPSIWGKLKAGIQFVAIIFAILRPGEPIAGTLYFDEWLMLAAAIITVLSAADYLQKFASALRG